MSDDYSALFNTEATYTFWYGISIEDSGSHLWPYENTFIVECGAMSATLSDP